MNRNKHFIMFFYCAHTQWKFCSSVSAVEVSLAQYGAHIGPGTSPKPTQEDTSTAILAKHTPVFVSESGSSQANQDFSFIEVLCQKTFQNFK